MRCDALEQILEEQFARALPEAAVTHLHECQNCRALAADLEAIRGLAMDLGTEDVAPAEHVWFSLRQQLEAEGIIREARPVGTRPVAESGKLGWWHAFQRPSLAGAFLSAAIVTAGLIGYGSFTQVSMHPPLAFDQEEISGAVPSAENVFKDEMLNVDSEGTPGFPKQDSAVKESIRRNLGIVDHFIAACKKSIREQPDNEMAREYLYGAYEQKAELLSSAMEHNMTGGLR